MEEKIRQRVTIITRRCIGLSAMVSCAHQMLSPYYCPLVDFPFTPRQGKQCLSRISCMGHENNWRKRTVICCVLGHYHNVTGEIEWNFYWNRLGNFDTPFSRIPSYNNNQIKLLSLSEWSTLLDCHVEQSISTPFSISRSGSFTIDSSSFPGGPEGVYFRVDAMIPYYYRRHLVFSIVYMATYLL